MEEKEEGDLRKGVYPLGLVIEAKGQENGDAKTC
jgi:hypothetical protein